VIALILFITFFVLLFLDIPIAFAMTLASMTAIFFSDKVHMLDVAREMGGAMQTLFPFVAVPYFLLAGEIMNTGGLSKRLIDFAQSLVGHRKGGLSMVVCMASMLFGGISGASSADTAAIGSVMIPAMEKKGYSKAFATSLAASAGSTGAIIPPSITMIYLGVVGNLKIESLFLGGIIPGILIGLSLMGVSYLYARSRNIPVEPKAGIKTVFTAFRRAVFTLLIPFVIVGGILSGLFTATESALIAVLCALVLGFFVYKELQVHELGRHILDTAKVTAIMGFMISAAFLFAYILSVERIPETITHFLMTISGRNTIVLLLFVNLALLLIGTFMDAGVAIFILVPVLLPIAYEIGMNPIHFGVMMVTNLTIGLITPPVGTTLFVACGISKISISEVTPMIARFLVVLFLIQLLITYVPELTLTIPSLLK
jgi:C4-dicarboxylate transporter DctM subunit